MKRFRPILLAMFLPLAGVAPAQQSGPVSYDISIAGRDAGSMTTLSKADGGEEVDYRYVDRGRGPELRSEIRVDDAGNPVSLSITGVDYFKVAVDERFDRTGGRATWQSAPDAGTTERQGFYYPNESTSEHLAVLARALLKAPGRRLPLIPEGEARLSEGGEHTLPGGEKARLFLIEGLQFRPTPIWLDTGNRLIAQGGTWTQTIRSDLKAHGPALIAFQDEVIVKRERAQSAALTRTPKGAVLFRGARVFDARARAIRADTDVLVEGNRIVAVGRGLAVSHGAEVIDASGKTLIPGLWDMHVHVNSNTDGLLHLSNGITTVRDMAMDMDELIQRRDRFDRGELAGPRIIMAGFMDGPGPLAAPSKALVKTPAEVREWVNRYADAGYVQIKLYSSLDPALVPVAIEAAHARGMRVSGHVPATMTLEQVVGLGFDEVQHANFWFLNFMDQETLAKTNGMTRFYAVGEKAKDFRLDSPETARMVKLLKERGIVLDPTMIAFEGMFLAKPRALPPELAATGERLPAAVRRGEMGGGLAKDDATRAGYAKSFDRMKEMLGLLHRSGITIVPGTDAMAGFTYARELELYVESGIPALEVLSIATLGSAKVMKRDGELGAIEPGYLADLVLLDGDPATRIGDIRNATLVMKDGKLFDPAALHAALGVAAR